MKTLLWVVGGAVGLFLLWAFARTESPEERAMWAAKDTIGLCWKEQGRKSLPPDQARFIAGACERMEADFRTKYRRDP